MDTRNDNYSKVKGEQFALNVDGKLGVSSSSSSSLHNRTGSNKNQEQQQQQQKYFRSNLMDKQVYVSSNAALGKMNKLYHLGAINESGLHLTPVQSVLQMRPSFEYFDIFEKKIKDLKEENDTGRALRRNSFFFLIRKIMPNIIWFSCFLFSRLFG